MTWRLKVLCDAMIGLGLVILPNFAGADSTELNIGKKVLTKDEIVRFYSAGSENQSPAESDDSDIPDTIDTTGSTRGVACRSLVQNCGGVDNEESSSNIFRPNKNTKSVVRKSKPVSHTSELKKSCEKKAISTEILFEFKSAAIPESAFPQLDGFREALDDEKLKNLSFIVEGYTDVIGSNAYNKDLSRRRAEAVKNYLLGDKNLYGRKITVIGRGEEDLANPLNPEGEENRRVKIAGLMCK